MILLETTERASHKPRVVSTHDGFTVTSERLEDIQRAQSLGMMVSDETLSLSPRYNNSPLWKEARVFTAPADSLRCDLQERSQLVLAGSTAKESTLGLAEDTEDEVYPPEMGEEELDTDC